MNKNYYAVIIAGGSGTRLWPKSRRKTPKHLINLFGDGSLLQLTLKRIKDLFDQENIYIITNKDHVDQIKDQLPNFQMDHIIPEPEARGTAMAMATAAAIIHKQNEEAIIFNLWADQMFEEPDKFKEAVTAALKAAESGDYLVSIGVRPTFPHTGLGYIKIGEEMDMINSDLGKRFVFRSAGFKEKPDLSTAQAFFASKQYLWNTGLYCWSTKSIFLAFEKYSPKLAEVFSKVENASNPLGVDFLTDLFGNVGNPDSIDYEVSEKAHNILVVPGEFEWNDVGDWKVVYDYEEKDKNGNAVISDPEDLILLDSKDNLIDGNGKMVAIVGLSNIVVVETDDAILICNKDKTQDVKKVVEKLKEENKKEYL